MVTFLLFVCIVVIIILLMTRPKGSSSAGYDQGYWDGYRALGDKVNEQLARSEIDVVALRREVLRGYGVVDNAMQPPQLAQESNSQQPIDAPLSLNAPQSTEIPIVSSLSNATAYPYADAASPEVLRAEKEARSLRNLNIVLYMASFLLVAAGALFIAAAMPDAVKLVGVWLIAGTFYGSGMLLHLYTNRLKPAATAFLGTGLALIPFAGFALDKYSALGSVAAWIVTSLIGIVAYFVAALRLRSQLVSYLTMAFVLSLACSSVASTTGIIVWQFVALIVVSLAANIVASIKPQWVPDIFHEPIERTGQLVTPLALVASLVTFEQQSIRSYEIVFGVATIHYAVVWLQTKQLVYETVIRALSSITILIVASDIFRNIVLWGVTLLAVTVGQQLYSLLRMKQCAQHVWEWNWIIVTLCLQFASLLLWVSQPQQVLLSIMTFAVLGSMSCVIAYHTRRPYIGLLALGSSVIVPFLYVLSSYNSMYRLDAILVVLLIIASILTLLLRARSVYGRPLSHVFAICYPVYFAAALLMSMTISEYWTIGVLFSGVISFTAASYIERRAVVQVASMILLPSGLFLVARQLGVANEWISLAAFGGAALIGYVLSYVYYIMSQYKRVGVIYACAQTLLFFELFGGVLSVAAAQATVITFIVMSIVSLLVRFSFKSRDSVMATTSVIAYPTLFVGAVIASTVLPAGWSGGLFAVGAILFWVASYVERASWLTIVGNVNLAVAVSIVWNELYLDSAWNGVGPSILLAVIYYFVYWLMVELRDPRRARVQLISTWVVLSIGILASSINEQTQLTGAWMIVAGGITVAVYGLMTKRQSVSEAAVYIMTLGMQCVVEQVIPSTNLVVYAHWWAIILVSVGAWRQSGIQTRAIIGMSLITCFGGIFALSHGGVYQLMFLVEHLALLVYGAISGKSWAIWWGIIASSLAILWFLREYTFLWLGFLGLLLIGIVVWQLMRNRHLDFKDII